MAKRYAYEAVLEKVEGGYTVKYPQLGVETWGKSRTEAIANASDLLALEVADRVESGEPLPKAEHIAEVLYINIDLTEEEIEETRYISMKDAQETLGLGKSRVSQLVSAGKLEMRVFGGRKMVSLESVNAFAESPRKAGRPRKEANA